MEASTGPIYNFTLNWQNFKFFFVFKLFLNLRFLGLKLKYIFVFKIVNVAVSNFCLFSGGMEFKPGEIYYFLAVPERQWIKKNLLDNFILEGHY